MSCCPSGRKRKGRQVDDPDTRAHVVSSDVGRWFSRSSTRRGRRMSMPDQTMTVDPGGAEVNVAPPAWPSGCRRPSTDSGRSRRRRRQSRCGGLPRRAGATRRGPPARPAGTDAVASSPRPPAPAAPSRWKQGHFTRLLHKPKTRSSSDRTGAGSEKAERKHCHSLSSSRKRRESGNPLRAARHSRGSGNPENFVLEVDSRFRGNDGLEAHVAYLHWQ